MLQLYGLMPPGQETLAVEHTPCRVHPDFIAHSKKPHHFEKEQNECQETPT